jgi:hypothetical protein
VVEGGRIFGRIWGGTKKAVVWCGGLFSFSVLPSVFLFSPVVWCYGVRDIEGKEWE